MMSLFLAAALSLPVTADATVIERARDERAFEDPQWLRLLYYPEGASRSEVISPGFFLSDTRTPQDEMEAAIRAWFQSHEADEHPACRFPARFDWLKQYLDLPPPATTPVCTRFDNWAKLEQLDSVSLLMVSGYLGNPASSFGHTLLKLNYTSQAEDNLLDMSFSFGAMVPEGELTPVYIVRGLTGGYQAGYSDKRFYAYDQVYSRTEFRDMWEYRLDLDEQEAARLAKHLWEIAGHKFDYYFLTHNCAFRMAELLSLATGRDLTPSAHLWYAPEELFHLVADENTLAGHPLVARIDFHASSQRRVHAQFSVLSDEEATLANALIETDAHDIDARLGSLEESRRVAVINALVAYYEYRLTGMEDNEGEALRAAQRRALAARLRLPSGGNPEIPIVPLPPPTAVHPPLLLGAGGSHAAGETSAWLRISPYFRDAISDPAGSKELVVLDTEFGERTDGSFGLKRTDLIRVRRFLTERTRLAGESHASWEIRLGANARGDASPDVRAEFNAGWGRAYRLTENVLTYLLVSGFLRDDGEHRLGAGPATGLIVHGETLRLELRAEPWRSEALEWESRWQLDARLPISRHSELAFGARREAGQTEWRAGLHFYW